jgi:hypothetical protein
MNFVNPLFFLGAAAIAIPVLLHLIKRERARKIEFSTLMYLRKVSRKTIRYQKLRHLLLLLLRVLAFALIVLAFTRPFLGTRQSAASLGRATIAHIILLDNSMSMGYGDRWEEGKKAAAAIVRSAQLGDKVALLEFSDRTFVRTSLTGDFAEALAQIEHGVELGDRATRYGQALKIAEKISLDAGTGKRVVHLISDFQKNGVTGEDQNFRLGAGAEIERVDLGSDEFSNLALSNVQVVEAADGGGELKIKCSLVNFGTQDRDNVKVALLVNGRSVAEQRFRVLKGESPPVEFSLPGLTPGAHPVSLEVEDANHVRDNRLVASVEALGRTPVTTVENAVSRLEGRSSSYFLSRALNISVLSPYELTAITPQKLEAAGAIPGSLLIWNNVSGASATLQKRLEEFAKNGGGLAIALGNSARAADFNRMFASWLPVKMEESGTGTGGRRPADDYALMTNINTTHPIFRPFSDPHSGTFANARFYAYARLTVAAGAEVLARLDNGTPALVAADVGKGRVLVFASSADDACNDLPLKAVYAPFWQQILRYLSNYQEERRWVEVGETVAPRKLLEETALRQGKNVGTSDQAVALLDPAGNRVEMNPGSDAVAVDKAGFYQVRMSGLNAMIPVNPTPRESDLSHGNSEEMVAGWISRDPEAVSATSSDVRLDPEEQERMQQFWRFLLLGALLFLLTEAYLSAQMSPNRAEGIQGPGK